MRKKIRALLARYLAGELEFKGFIGEMARLNPDKRSKGTWGDALRTAMKVEEEKGDVE